MVGPRLDRPSAVGDEGRPRAASQTVAAVVAVGLAAVTLFVWDSVGPLTLLGLGASLFVGGLALLGRSGIADQTVGHVLYHTGAAGVVVLAVVAVGGTSQTLAIGGFYFALLGVAGTWTNSFERDAFEAATRNAALSYVAAIGWLVVLLAGLIVAAIAWLILAAVLDARTPSQSLFGFLGVLTFLGLLVRVACWAVPVGPLAPHDRRGAYVAAIGRVARASLVLAIASFGAMLLAVVVGVGRIDSLGASGAVAGPTFDLLSSGPVILGLAAVAGLATVMAVVGLGSREVASQLDAGNYGLIAAVLAGFVFTIVVLVASLAGPMLAPFLFGLVVGLALIAPLVTIVASFLVVAAIDWGVVPRRATGPALAAAGLLVAGMGVALGNLPAPLVFACVAGAMVVWDCGTFGLGLTIELGHRPETRRLELYHGVLSVGVGAAVVVVASGLEALRASAGSAIGAWPAVGLAVLGAVLLVVAVRRRAA